MLDNIRSYLRQGHTAVKIKLGKDTVAEDAARVAAVRELIGPDRTLMVDANYKWTAENALRVCRAIAPYRPLWMEEPVDPDDPGRLPPYDAAGGHRRRRRRKLSFRI